MSVCDSDVSVVTVMSVYDSDDSEVSVVTSAMANFWMILRTRFPAEGQCVHLLLAHNSAASLTKPL